ncbi:WecB/TagA/CpsF family glycosyltransferase [Aliikangiella marina]|uniref:WecB/TagA/CpsF family glycosyltransferase n=1 Tax=Aliikangiella marina TaxID=1712262 RepID=A0A545TIN5_9GAMM|nr:WecB/TagA/CpsF family glycosyltransferase [Aliikangiella marina]TQV77036.1 WecB/TagA/CpsF family glycosyltransferase [Aliikangiella marina]
MTKNLPILGFKVSTEPVKQIIEYCLNDGKNLVVNTINPHSYIEQKSDKDFRDALLKSDVLIPDGSGIVFAARYLKGVRISKIAGYELFTETMKLLNQNKGKVLFLGSSHNTLAKIKERASKDFENVDVYTHSPPFKPAFTEDDYAEFVRIINEFSPDVLFVGLTAPKQEKLIESIRNRIDVKFSSGIGAVFDFYAGTINRPSSIWIKLHLEWFVRLIGEPKRLWRRNFISTPLFLKDVLLSKKH